MPICDAHIPAVWVFVDRNEMYVAGAAAVAPRSRFICRVPEGQYDEERRAAVPKAMTDAGGARGRHVAQPAGARRARDCLTAKHGTLGLKLP